MSVVSILAGTMLLSSTAAASGALPCASPADSTLVQEFYEKTRPGAPLPVAGRTFNIPELTAASGLPAARSVGAAGSVENVRKVWQSIESWGAGTKVSLVLSSGGGHAFNFPSKVPMPKADTGESWLDAEADGGAGVHAHIYSPLVKAIYATQIQGKEPGWITRAISFYGADGKLILGVYAQVDDDPFDQAAVDGFARTLKLIEGLPRVCAR